MNGMETKVLLETSKISYFSEKYTEKSDIQFKNQEGTSTHVGPTNVGRYKPKTYKRRTVQMSDQEKRPTGTNVGLVQTSDSTNDGPVQTSDRYKRRTKVNKYLNF